MPLVCPRSMRTVTRRPRSPGTRSGRYPPMGSSSRMRPRSTCCITAAAVKVLVTLPTRCRRPGVTGRPVTVSAVPAAPRQVRPEARTSANTPGMPAPWTSSRAARSRPGSSVPARSAPAAPVPPPRPLVPPVVGSCMGPFVGSFGLPAVISVVITVVRPVGSGRAAVLSVTPMVPVMLNATRQALIAVRILMSSSVPSVPAGMPTGRILGRGRVSDQPPTGGESVTDARRSARPSRFRAVCGRPGHRAGIRARGRRYERHRRGFAVAPGPAARAGPRGAGAGRIRAAALVRADRPHTAGGGSACGGTRSGSLHGEEASGTGACDPSPGPQTPASENS